MRTPRGRCLILFFRMIKKKILCDLLRWHIVGGRIVMEGDERNYAHCERCYKHVLASNDNKSCICEVDLGSKMREQTRIFRERNDHLSRERPVSLETSGIIYQRDT